MIQDFMEVVRDRFHLLNPQLYILQGYYPKGFTLEAFLDQMPLKIMIDEWEITTAWERYQAQQMPLGVERVNVTVCLPETLKKYRQLKIYARDGSKRKIWYSVKVRDLLRQQNRPYYYIEEAVRKPDERCFEIRGWAVFKNPVEIQITDGKGQSVACELLRNDRSDVAALYSEVKIQDKCGFWMRFNEPLPPAIRLEFKADGGSNVWRLKLNRISMLKRRMLQLAGKAVQYGRSYGLARVAEKTIRKILKKEDRPITYSEWLKKHHLSQGMLERQRRRVFERKPLFSIIVPLYKTPEKYLRKLIQSIQGQTYTNWELCLSDGSGENSPLDKLLAELQSQDSRIKVQKSAEALKISENTNAAIQIATGDYLVFVDHDDELTPDALYECADVVNKKPETEIVYSDEDKMSMDGGKYFQPHMKPDFNSDLLCSVNYICHLFVAKRTLVQRLGGLRAEYDGAQDYDLILRCVEQTKYIQHIPKVLYHWRSHEGSTSENPESKMYAFDAGQRAVQAHYDRLGIPAVAEKGEYLGLYRTKYHWTDQPLISILIPNKDHTEDLERCIRSIESRSSYKNYEYIIIENNSEEKKTFDYYERLKEKNPRVNVVYWKEGFNYSAINNYGAQFAKGDYLLLLNNDTEIINAECLEELLGFCMREDVGAVGARLYYEDDTIQHAGVVIGFGGIAGHCFVQQPRDSSGYCHRIICAQNYSAVTAACMMVKRKAFDQVNGLDPGLAVAFNDIDFCLRLQQAGYLIVYNPYAELYHYESKSRGIEDTPQKKERFNKEVDFFYNRWSKILEEGDPYYNPNLTLESQDFSLRRN